MIHVFPRWSFGYLLQAKPKHTAAGHEVICGTWGTFKMKQILFISTLILTLTCCQSKLADGWYISSTKSNAVQKSFTDYTDIVTSLDPNPVVLKENFIETTVDSNPDYDESLRIEVVLSEKDKKKWDQTIETNVGEHLYFLLGDTLISFQKIDGQNNDPNIWLSFSDYNQNQVKSMIEGIRKK